MGSHKLQLPTINFNGLDPNQPFGSNWETARTQVLAALQSYGCFDVVYDGVRPEVKELQSIMPEMFALPLELKQLDKSNYSYLHHGQFTDVTYESILVQDASNPESVNRFAQNLWPEGNQKFCNTVTTYAQKSRIVEQIVERMIFQSMSIEKYCNSHLESVSYVLRFSSYGDLPIDEAKVSLPAHVDHILMNIIYQNGVEGLKVYTKNGECIRVVPSPDTFTVIIGEGMMVLTNGRFHSPVHCVSINQKRYSLLFGSIPKEGYLIQPSKEIVDENHPLQFHPFDVHKYFEFKYSPEGLKAENPLKAFCGVQEQREK